LSDPAYKVAICHLELIFAGLKTASKSDVRPSSCGSIEDCLECGEVDLPTTSFPNNLGNGSGTDSPARQNLDPVTSVIDQALDKGQRVEGRILLATGEYARKAEINNLVESNKRVRGHVERAMKDGLSIGNALQNAAAAFNVNRAIRSQDAEDEAIGIMRDREPRVTFHRRHFCFAVAETASTGTNHDHDWNRYTGFGLENCSDRRRKTTEKKCGAKFDTIGATGLRFDRVVNGTTTNFKQNSRHYENKGTRFSCLGEISSRELTLKIVDNVRLHELENHQNADKQLRPLCGKSEPTEFENG
jgi:hypothetical protein